MFKEMMQQIRWEIVHHVFRLNLENFDAQALEQRREQELEEIAFQSAGQAEPLEPRRRDESKVGRNDDCSCGSGKKYKKCCGQ